MVIKTGSDEEVIYSQESLTFEELIKDYDWETYRVVEYRRKGSTLLRANKTSFDHRTSAISNCIKKKLKL